MSAGKKILPFVICIGLLMLISNKTFGATTTAKNIIIKWEQVKLTAYKDSGGVWTIGIGSTWNWDESRKVRSADVITEATAYRWFNKEFSIVLENIKDLITVPVTNNQLSALVSLVYNIGLPAFRESDLLEKLNQGKSKEVVAAEFDRWIYDNGHIITGLINRRKDEKELFLK